jgi:hypothetical protein
MKKIILLLFLIPNLVIGEIVTADIFHGGPSGYPCTSETIKTTSKKIHGTTFQFKTTETRMAKANDVCYPYTYDYDNSKDILGDDTPRKMTEFIIINSNNNIIEQRVVDNSHNASPIKLIEGSEDFPYTMISTYRAAISRAFNVLHIYSTSPSFKKIGTLKSNIGEMKFYKSGGLYLIEEITEQPIADKSHAEWPYNVETFALINDELISVHSRRLDKTDKRYDICLNPDFKTLDCYLEGVVVFYPPIIKKEKLCSVGEIVSDFNGNILCDGTVD